MSGDKILIVDDDSDVRRLLSRTLHKAGFRVSQAIDGCDAVEMLRKEPFDLIFLDLKMPYMDGMDTFNMVKALDPHAEIVILTGHASLNTALFTLRRGGAYDYLTKPVNDVDELVKITKKALERRRLALEVAKYQRESKSFKRRVKEATDRRNIDLRRQMDALEDLVENKMAFLKRISTELKHQLANMEVALASQKSSLKEAQLNRFKGTVNFLDYFCQLTLGGRVMPDCREKVDISQMVGMISRRVSGFAKGNVYVGPFEGPGYVRGDLEMLMWAIAHLVENGLRFVKPEGEGVSVSFTRKGGRLDIEVADDGPGIARHDAKDLFKFFYQGRQTKGGGVGLALVKSIVEEHGGTIRVKSKPREGSKFIIALPVSDKRRCPKAIP